MYLKFLVASLPVLILVLEDCGKDSPKKSTDDWVYAGEAKGVIAGKSYSTYIGTSLLTPNKKNTFWFDFGENKGYYNPIWGVSISEIQKQLGKQEVHSFDAGFKDTLTISDASYYGGNFDGALDRFDLDTGRGQNYINIDSQRNDYHEVWGHYYLLFNVSGTNREHYFPDTFSCYGNFHVLPQDVLK